MRCLMRFIRNLSWWSALLLFSFLQDSLDSLVLNPVYQVIMAISENTEQLSEKIK